MTQAATERAPFTKARGRPCSERRRSQFGAGAASILIAPMLNHRRARTQEYVDHESGRKGAKKRKQFAALFDDMAKRKFDCVLFWALDRFSREGMVQTIVHLQRLT